MVCTRPILTSPIGSIVPAARILVVSGHVFLQSLEIGYGDTSGSCFAQVHDAIDADTLSSDTMVLPFGLPIDGSANLLQLLEWSYQRQYSRGVTVAASSSRITYAASAVKLVAKGAWF